MSAHVHATKQKARLLFIDFEQCLDKLSIICLAAHCENCGFAIAVSVIKSDIGTKQDSCLLLLLADWYQYMLARARVQVLVLVLVWATSSVGASTNISIGIIIGIGVWVAVAVLTPVPIRV